MPIGDLFKFRRKKEFKPEATLPRGDVGWSELSAIYSNKDFEKYNPDDLIGRKGYAIYKKMMTDEQVKAVTRFKRDAVTSRNYRFDIDAEKSGLSDDEIEKRLCIAKLIIDKMNGNFVDALNGVMTATYNGFSMTEKVFMNIEYEGLTYWGIDKLKLKPYDTFYFKVDEYGNIEEYIQKMAGREQSLDIDKFIHYVVNPDIDEHYGGSELRDVYRAWFSKDTIIKFRNMWLERHAGGFRMIKPKEGKNLAAGSSEMTQLQNILNNINTATSIVLPNWVEMESDYPANNVAFAQAIQDYDMAIARGMLVPNLLGVSPQGQHGSLSQSETQLESFIWTLEADASRLEDVLNEQLFRHLGEVNFGDDWWPKFSFDPMSDKKKFELITSWKELVASGAVRHTDTDEQYLRELLEFPEAGEEIATNNPLIPPSEDAEQAPSKLPEGDGSPASGTDDNMPKRAEPEEELTKDYPDETVSGKGIVSIETMTRAEKRVNFSVIKTKSENIESEYVDVYSKISAGLLDDAINRIDEAEMLNNAEAAANFKLNPRLITKFRKQTTRMLDDGWNLGLDNAKKEIDKAKGSDFSKVNLKKIAFISEEYFAQKSYLITGKFTDDMKAMINNAISNGIKFEKSTQEVAQDIYNQAASAGMISIDDVPQAFMEAVKDTLNANDYEGYIRSSTARLNTIIRTNTFEAINEARFNYFNDASLGGFVEAQEYSAILDSRTTNICKHLDGQIHAIDSEVWSQYRPPNHFNCRSLLIPVTAADIWVESDKPTQEPQKGFE